MLIQEPKHQEDLCTRFNTLKD